MLLVVEGELHINAKCFGKIDFFSQLRELRVHGLVLRNLHVPSHSPEASLLQPVDDGCYGLWDDDREVITIMNAWLLA